MFGMYGTKLDELAGHVEEERPVKAVLLAYVTAEENALLIALRKAAAADKNFEDATTMLAEAENELDETREKKWDAEEEARHALVTLQDALTEKEDVDVERLARFL